MTGLEITLRMNQQLGYNLPIRLVASILEDAGIVDKLEVSWHEKDPDKEGPVIILDTGPSLTKEEGESRIIELLCTTLEEMCFKS